VQLNVTPITIYKTEEQYSLGQLIAVNPSFICYSVKGDMVRILAATNASLRALLRGHTKPVHDLAFAPTLEADGAAILATAAKDGQCLIWRLIIKEKEITTDIIAKPTADSGVYYTRVLWNTAQSRQLFTIRSDAAVQIWNVDAASTSCVRTLALLSPVLCVAFNEASIAFGSKDGFVSLYSQNSDNVLQRWQPHGGKSVTFVALRPHSIVTGARKNRVFRLWDLNTSRLAQELELVAREPKYASCFHFGR
jgi:WD40 repeat protein